MTTLNRSSLKWLIADALLGEDIISPTEIAGIRSLPYSDKQLIQLEEATPSEYVLRWCKQNGYAMTACPPESMSFPETMEWEPYQFHERIPELACFWADKTFFGWLAFYKGVVPDSLRKNMDEQKAMFPAGASLPNAAELGWLLTTYYATRGVTLLDEASGLRAYTSSTCLSRIEPKKDEPLLLGPFSLAHCCNRKYFCSDGVAMPKVRYANVGSVPVLRFPV
jgi:hypothetical protein